MIRLELGRGPFLRPVLVRAVRAAGVQARLDVEVLSTAASLAEAVACAWIDTAAEGPLRVSVVREPGSVHVIFAFPDREAAALARATPQLPPGDAPVDRLGASLREGSEPPGWELVLVAS